MFSLKCMGKLLQWSAPMAGRETAKLLNERCFKEGRTNVGGSGIDDDHAFILFTREEVAIWFMIPPKMRTMSDAKLETHGAMFPFQPLKHLGCMLQNAACSATRSWKIIRHVLFFFNTLEHRNCSLQWSNVIILQVRGPSNMFPCINRARASASRVRTAMK